MSPLSEEQLAKRHLSLGASEVAAAVGLNPFTTPLDVWLKKTLKQQPETTPKASAGHRFEQPIADWYAELESAQLVEPSTIYHPSEPWISCTPDRLWTNAKRAAQVKLVGFHMAFKWSGNDFADGQSWWRYTIDGVPRLERVQCEWELLVLEETHGIHEIDLVSMTGTDLRVYRFRSDAELRSMLLAEARAFWACVESDEPPAVDGSDSWKAYLDARFPVPEREPLDPMPLDVTDLCRAYRKAAQIEERAAEAKKLRRNQIAERIGAGSGFIGPEFKATWKADKNGKRSLCVKEL